MIIKTKFFHWKRVLLLVVSSLVFFIELNIYHPHSYSHSLFVFVHFIHDIERLIKIAVWLLAKIDLVFFFIAYIMCFASCFLIIPFGCILCSLFLSNLTISSHHSQLLFGLNVFFQAVVILVLLFAFTCALQNSLKQLKSAKSWFKRL